MPLIGIKNRHPRGDYKYRGPPREAEKEVAMLKNIQTTNQLYAVQELLKLLDHELREQPHITEAIFGMVNDLLNREVADYLDDGMSKDQELRDRLEKLISDGLTREAFEEFAEWFTDKFYGKVEDLPSQPNGNGCECACTASGEEEGEASEPSSAGFTVSLYQDDLDRTAVVQANTLAPDNFIATFAEGTSRLWEALEEACEEPGLRSRRQFSRFMSKWFGNAVQLLMALAGMGYIRKVRAIRGRELKASEEEMGNYKVGFAVIWYEEPPIAYGILGPVIRYEYEDEFGGVVGVQIATYADEVSVMVDYQGDPDCETALMIQDEVKYWRTQVHRVVDSINRLLAFCR